MTPPSITHRPAEDGSSGSFDLMNESTPVGYLSYSLADRATMIVNYVEVDPELRGKRMGQQLVAAAVDWARVQERKIVPLCSYARAVMLRTREFQDVLKR